MKCKVAVLGAGSMAKRFLASSNANCEVTHIWSRELSNAKKLADGISGCTPLSGAIGEDLAKCLIGENVTHVYIALPNAAKDSCIKPLAEVGLNILCEKPLTLKSSNISEYIEKNYSVNEAMWTSFNTVVRGLKKIKLSGFYTLESVLSFRNPPDSRILNDKYEGGAVADLLCYQLCLVDAFFSSSIDRIQDIEFNTVKNSKGVITGYDIMIRNEMFSAKLSGYIDRDYESSFSLVGAGQLELLGPVFNPWGIKVKKMSLSNHFIATYLSLMGAINRGVRNLIGSEKYDSYGTMVGCFLLKNKCYDLKKTYLASKIMDKVFLEERDV